jgi:hydrogenase maturation protease
MIQPSGGASDESPGTIKVIGIGQSLRGDDASGLYAVLLWQETYEHVAHRPHVQVELAELPGIGMLNLLEGVSCAILVDAVRSGAKVGTIHLLTPDQLESFGAGAGSAHGWGDRGLAWSRLVPESMPEIWIVGIEAGVLTLGQKLSPEVEMALPEAAHLIERLVVQACQD